MGQKSYTQNSDGQAAVYNIVSSAFIGGLGAIINKDKDDRFGRTFLKGVGQGVVGGYLVFESKRLIRNFSERRDYAYIWPSRILNAMGNSITMNGAKNRGFGQTWYINIGFGHFNMDFQRKNPVKVRILPISLVLTARRFVVAQFDFKKSLRTGLFVFKDELNTNVKYGIASANTITYHKDLAELEVYDVIAHEFIHVYQKEDVFATNSYLDKYIVRLEEKI